MAVKGRTFADLTTEEEQMIAQQPGAEAAIDEEIDKYKRMMDDCAGVTDGEIVYWLHKANDKNKSLHATYLKRYPKDTPLSEIHDEARDKYGPGDYVLVAKKDDVMFRKLPFSTGVPIQPEKAVEIPKVDPFTALSGSIEKALVMDRAAAMMAGKKEDKGVDPSITLLTTVLTGMMAQNTALLQGMMTQRNTPPPAQDNTAMIEAVKLGVSVAGGKLPFEEGEGGGWVEILKGLAPYVPQLIAGLRGAPPVAPMRRAPVAPHPLPATPAAAGVITAAVPPTDPRALVMARIVEEIRFVLTLPPTPKLYDHVIDYIDAYMPEIIKQAEVIEAETFADYVVTLDPAFTERKQFFLDLHKHLLSSMEEVVPEPEVPERF
jgi:hypothetical protein